MLNGLQIIEEKFRKQKVIDNRKYQEASENIVSVDGQLCENQVVPDTTKEGLRELSAKKAEDISEKNAKDINEEKDNRNDVK